MRPALLASFLALAATPLAARADLDVVVGNGDSVAGSLVPGTEVDTIRAIVPKDALVSVSVKGLKKKGAATPAVTFTVRDPDGTVVGASATVVKGTGARMKGVAAPKSGEYRIVVTGDGTEGSYSLVVSWKSRTSFPAAGTFAGAPQTFAFSADAGATASFSVKSAKSAALPRLVDLRTAADDVLRQFDAPADPAAKSHAVAGVGVPGGDLRLRVGDAGGGGAFAGTIKVKAPKTSKRKLTLTGTALSGPLGDTAARVLGAEGGLVEAGLLPAITGASVSIPPGALSGPTAIVLALASTSVPTQGGEILGEGSRPIFLGPDGLTFLAGQTARVTIPYVAGSTIGGTARIRVFTQASDGALSEITPVTVDPGGTSVSFATSHFSTFQLFGPPRGGQIAKLVPASAVAGDGVGSSCALSGPRAVLGASGTDASASFTSTGAAYVLVDGPLGWAEEQNLYASDPSTDALFGGTVAIEGDRIVIGARQHTHSLAPSDAFTGSVYVFDRTQSGWAETAELRAAAPFTGMGFGSTVAMSGDTIAVGAPGSDANSLTGAVYVFRKSGGSWSEEARIVPVDASDFDGIGSCVALQGDTLVFGRASGSSSAGAAWVYARSGTTWSLEQRLEDPVPAQGDEFGRSGVALDSDTILVGATRGSQSGSPSPDVSVFVRSGVTWTRQAGLTLGRAPTFGRSVAIFGDQAFAGWPAAPLVVGGGPQPVGAAKSFRRSGAIWSASVLLLPGDPAAGQTFGSTVALDATRVLVAAPADSNSRGAVYVFDNL